jgi:hypothetical protein
MQSAIYYAECRILFVFILSVIMMSIVILNAIMLSVIMMSIMVPCCYGLKVYEYFFGLIIPNYDVSN